MIAHTGHWLAQSLYLAPMLVMGAAVGLGKLRGRRSKRAGAGPSAR
jgi:hypothetical protein